MKDKRPEREILKIERKIRRRLSPAGKLSLRRQRETQAFLNSYRGKREKAAALLRAIKSAEAYAALGYTITADTIITRGTSYMAFPCEVQG